MEQRHAKGFSTNNPSLDMILVHVTPPMYKWYILMTAHCSSLFAICLYFPYSSRHSNPDSLSTTIAPKSSDRILDFIDFWSLVHVVALGKVSSWQHLSALSAFIVTESFSLFPVLNCICFVKRITRQRSYSTTQDIAASASKRGGVLSFLFFSFFANLCYELNYTVCFSRFLCSYE